MPADLQSLLKMKHPVWSHQSRMVWVGQICPMAQLLLTSHHWEGDKWWLVRLAASQELTDTHPVWAQPSSWHHKCFSMWSETAVLTCSHKKQKQPAAQIVSQVMLIQRQKNFTGESGAFFLLCSLGATLQKEDIGLGSFWFKHSQQHLCLSEKSILLTDTFAFAHSSWFEDEPFVYNLGASLNGCYPPKVFLPSVFSKRERFSFLP